LCRFVVSTALHFYIAIHTIMDKLQFFRATVFDETSTTSHGSLQGTEILIPVEAISYLKKMASGGHRNYEVVIKENYILSLPFPPTSIRAIITTDSFDIL